MKACYLKVNQDSINSIKLKKLILSLTIFYVLWWSDLYIEGVFGLSLFLLKLKIETENTVAK